MQQLTEKDFSGTKVFPFSFKTFKCNTDNMNYGKINDTPKGALICTEKISISNLDTDLNFGKFGYVIFNKEYIHTDIINYDPAQKIALCRNRNSEDTFQLNLKDAEVLKVSKLHY